MKVQQTTTQGERPRNVTKLMTTKQLVRVRRAIMFTTQEDHLEQIKLARSKASNLLVPDDYDGSTYHAKLSREIAQVSTATNRGAQSVAGRTLLSEKPL